MTEFFAKLSDKLEKAFVGPATFENLTSKILQNSPAGIESILKRNPDLVNVAGENGQTALHLSAASGKAILTRILLQNGADGQLQDKNGQTALQLAETAGHSVQTTNALREKAGLPLIRKPYPKSSMDLIMDRESTLSGQAVAKIRSGKTWVY